jgi:aspartate racemase
MSAGSSQTREVAGREALWDAVRSTLRSQRDGPLLERVPRDAALPASFSQQGGFILERLLPASPHHNLAVSLQLTGRLNTQCLERSLEEMVTRHEILRTTLRLVDGELLQVIHSPTKFTLPVTDLSEVDTTDRAAEARRQSVAEAYLTFDIERAPLVRARLFRLDQTEHLLVLTVHHLVFDGWSFELFMREICTIYGALLGGLPSPLPEPVLQYADWAAWQRRRMNAEATQQLLLYWQDQLRGPAPVLPLPYDRPRKGDTTPEVGRHPFALSKELTATLKHLGTEAGATPFVTILAGFQVLLYRYTHEEDIVVGSPIANRNRIELDGMVGCFVNTLALRVRLGGRPSFRELLVRVRDVVFDAYRHQDLPFEALVKSLAWERESGVSAFLQVMFAFENVPRSRWKFPGLVVESSQILNGTVHSHLSVFLKEEGDRFSGSFEYNATLFDATTIKRMVDHFIVLLEGIALDPGRSIASIPLISAAEREWLLKSSKGPAVEYPNSMAVHRIFEAQVKRAPDAAAILIRDKVVTYAELDRLANRLAHYLASAGVRPDDLVGLCLDSSPLRIAAMLAVLKCGAAYVPMDPVAPRVLNDLALTVVLTDRAMGNGDSIQNIPVLNLDSAVDEVSAHSPEPMQTNVGAESIAYVMFTSGSTGIPKGICIPHRAIVRLVSGANYVEIAPNDVFIQLAPVSFDASTFEVWGALLNGAKLVIPAPQLSLAEIAETLDRYRVSIVFFTTRLFELMVETHIDALSAVRQVLMGGDVLSVPHAERFARHTIESRLIHCYGPTENTTFTTFYRVTAGETFPGGTVPIGQPISNTQIYILDALQQPAPIGVVGEAYVGGDGLMRGYLNDAELTCERMIANPFDCAGKLLYRTGDRARYRNDGSIEFHGRTDEQVKIRGFRVEPAEVEILVRRCPLVKNAAVVARKGHTGEMRLIAFVVTEPFSANRPGIVSEMRGFLRAQLPRYLVPSEFVLLDALPLNANGKVDRHGLQMPIDRQPTTADSFIPRDRIEMVVLDQFKRVLGDTHVGPEDSFFDIGGDSLLALRLFAEVEEALGIRLPLVSLFEHPTIVEFAEVLRNATSADLGAGIVEIKSGRSQTPLFLVPSGAGGKTEMTLYAKMMSHLRSEQRVYGLRTDTICKTHDASIEERAAACVSEIRRVQPHGPYALGGECVGGVVAFEMAQQLMSSGERVTLLVLIDTWFPSSERANSHWFCRLRPILATLNSVRQVALGNLRRDLHSDLERETRRFRWFDVALTLKRKGVSGVRNLTHIVRSARRASSTLKQVMSYRPKIYRGPLTLLVCAQWSRLGVAEQWRRLAGNTFVVHTLAGTHESYIRNSPDAAAHLLGRCLDEVREDVP